MLKGDPKEIQKPVISYLIQLKKLVELGEISPNGIRTRMTPINTFYEQNDIELNWKKIKRMFPRQEKKKGDLPYTVTQIQSIYKCANTIRDESLVLTFTSTGMRPEALMGLEMKHIIKRIHGCIILLLYPNDTEEYPVILTPEATTIYDAYVEDRKNNGEKIIESSPLYRNNYGDNLSWKNIKPMTMRMLYCQMQNMVKEARIRPKLKHQYQRHRIALFGGFRKWFETTLNDINEVNSNVVEKLMGHKNDLRGTYYNPELKKRFDKFQKAIPFLTLDSSIRKQFELDKVKKEKSDLENVNLILKETVKEKDSLAKKYREDLTQQLDDAINKKIDEILSKQKDL